MSENPFMQLVLLARALSDSERSMHAQNINIFK